MLVNLSGTVNEKMLDTLITAVNEALQKQENLIVYLYTEGGDAAIMHAILHIFNLGKDFIELIGTGTLYSAGFYIFFNAECQKILLDHTFGMIHYPATTATIDARGTVKHYDNFTLESIKEMKSIFLKFVKELPLTEKELESFIKGEEVYFTNRRMKQLLKNEGKSNITGTREVRGKSGGISNVLETKHNYNKGKR